MLIKTKRYTKLPLLFTVTYSRVVTDTFAWFDMFYLNFGLFFFFRHCFESDAFQTLHDYDTAWDV